MIQYYFCNSIDKIRPQMLHYVNLCIISDDKIFEDLKIKVTINNFDSYLINNKSI